MRDDRAQLIQWLNLLSVKTGEEFTLASGQKSNVYVDVKKTAQHHRGSKLLARLLAQKIYDERELTPFSAVAGVVLGGCHLASIVSMQIPIDLDIIFIRKEAKDHGTQVLIERPNMTPGQQVVVLEDVVTTGNSAVEAARLLEKESFIVNGIIAVVDRRPVQTPQLKEFKFVSLVKFEELTA
jgi:orotate phosphoribosyltransferase